MVRKWRFVPVTDPQESAQALRDIANRVERYAPDMAAKFRRAADAAEPPPTNPPD